MTTEQKEKIISEYSNQILELINSQEDLTWSDTDGIAMAIIMNVIRETEKCLS